MKGPTAGMATRPMADKIKEALFSVLASLGVEYDRVLDLYAGTGSIGIEALSRGASWCDFVDRNAAATKIIGDNLALTGYADRARVHQSDILPFVRRATEPYDMVILDPPYADPDILSTLEAVSRSAAVLDGTIVVLGHWPRLDVPEQLGRLVKLRGRCHGDSCFAVFDVVDEVDEVTGDR